MFNGGPSPGKLSRLETASAKTRKALFDADVVVDVDVSLLGSGRRLTLVTPSFHPDSAATECIRA